MAFYVASSTTQIQILPPPFTSSMLFAQVTELPDVRFFISKVGWVGLLKTELTFNIGKVQRIVPGKL